MFVNNKHFVTKHLHSGVVSQVTWWILLHYALLLARSGTTQYGGCATPNYQTHGTETQRRLTIGTNTTMDGLGPTLRRNIACPRNHDQKVSELDSTYVRLEKWVKSEVRKYTAVLSKEFRKNFCPNGLVLFYL
jgi:hypothetical protein